MKIKIVVLILTILALFGTLFALAAPPDLSGTWIGKATVPDGNQDELTLVLTKVKTVYTGTVADSFGMIAQNTELKDIKLEKNEFTANFSLSNGAPITFKLTVSGDKMSGQWLDSGGSTGALEFEKKK